MKPAVRQAEREDRIAEKGDRAVVECEERILQKQVPVESFEH